MNTSALAEALSEIDNPAVIEEVLTESSVDIQSASLNNNQPTLQDLYNRYLSRRRNRSPATIAQYKRTIPRFIDFAQKHELKYPGSITTEIVDEWVDTLFETHEADATIVTYTKNVRAWLNWISKRNLCTGSVVHILNKDDLGLAPNVRDAALPAAEAIGTLHRLQTQRRGANRHAIMELSWNVGLRLGSIHSLDVPDFHPEGNKLLLRHRPETGTRLKNGSEGDSKPGDGERNVTLHPKTVDALERYIECERPDVTDEYGREPLFATSSGGRASQSTLRRWIYDATSCRWADVNESELSCDGTCSPDSDVCPFSYSPHAIRRGAIVSHLTGGLGYGDASERFDVSIRVLKRHYDPRTKEQRKNDRESNVRNAWSDRSASNNRVRS